MFDLETGVRVTSKVGNLHSKFGHARPLGSRIIRYVRDGRTDRRTNELTDGRTRAMLIASFHVVGSITMKSLNVKLKFLLGTTCDCNLSRVVSSCPLCGVSVVRCVQVLVKDPKPTRDCISIGDPHLTTFDNK